MGDDRESEDSSAGPRVIEISPGMEPRPLDRGRLTIQMGSRPVPDRDLQAARLVAFLAAVLSTATFSQAQDPPSARPEPWSRSDAARAYAEYRPTSTEAVQLPRPPAVRVDPFSSMLHKSLSRNVIDRQSMQVFGSLSRCSVDPRVEGDLLRKCRVAIRERLKELHLPFDVDQGQAVNLGSLSLLETAPAPADDDTLSSDTAQTAALKAAGRKRHDQWKVTFRLTYRGILLEKSSTVVILTNGDRLRIEWRNLPRTGQLPPDAELEANVSRDEALATGLDNFRLRVEKMGDKPLAEKVTLEPSTPSLNLWFPPEGIGKLAWTFSVVARTDEVAHVGSGSYHIEARKPVDEMKPRILAHYSAPIFRSTETRTTGMADPSPSSRLR